VNALACTGEPISWLRLERHALGELDGGIAAHLEGCAACRAVLERISGDDRPLPRLVLPEPKPRKRWWPVWAGAALAAAAVLLFFVLRGEDRQPAHPGPRIAIKGGEELIVSVIREVGGDRYKVRVTCSAPIELDAEVVVHQDGEASRPFPAARLRCGNEVVLPGAFTLTSRAPAVVCLAVRGAGTGCVQVEPAQP
jgi:hypothetical protein